MHLLVDLRTVDDHFPGIGRWSYETTRALVELEIKLTLILGKRSQTDFNIHALEKRADIVWSDAAIFGLQQMIEFPLIAKRARVDAALFPYYIRPLWMPCPSVTVIHDTISWRVPELFSRTRRWQINLFHQAAIRASDAIATDSQASAKDIQQFYGVDPAKITVVYAGTSANFKPQPPDGITETRQRLGLPIRYILFLASDKPHKNMRFLIEAWRAADKADVQLVCAGRWRDPATEAYVQTLQPADQVMLLRDVAEADLAALYSGALAFAFPSRYEGFGMPVLEALACGTSVIAADTSCLPEIVGQAGILLPLDSLTWTQTLGTVCTTEHWHKDLRDPQTQAAEFRWSTTAQRLSDVVRSMI